MDATDLFYFRDRAEAELLAAECASHPEAARAHFLLAGYYLDRAHNCAGDVESSAGVRRGNPRTRIHSKQ